MLGRVDDIQPFMDYQSPTQAVTSDDSGIVEVWWLAMWCHGGATQLVR